MFGRNAVSVNLDNKFVLLTCSWLAVCASTNSRNTDNLSLSSKFNTFLSVNNLVNTQNHRVLRTISRTINSFDFFIRKAHRTIRRNGLEVSGYRIKLYILMAIKHKALRDPYIRRTINYKEKKKKEFKVRSLVRKIRKINFNSFMDFMR